MNNHTDKNLKSCTHRRPLPHEFKQTHMAHTGIQTYTLSHTHILQTHTHMYVEMCKSCTLTQMTFSFMRRRQDHQTSRCSVILLSQNAFILTKFFSVLIKPTCLWARTNQIQLIKLFWCLKYKCLRERVPYLPWQPLCGRRRGHGAEFLQTVSDI